MCLLLEYNGDYVRLQMLWWDFRDKPPISCFSFSSSLSPLFTKDKPPDSGRLILFLRVGLSMMCYREGKEERTSLGERQLRGRMGKSLYFLFQTASCFWKSSKEKNLCEA